MALVLIVLKNHSSAYLQSNSQKNPAKRNQQGLKQSNNGTYFI